MKARKEVPIKLQLHTTCTLRPYLCPSFTTAAALQPAALLTAATSPRSCLDLWPHCGLPHSHYPCQLPCVVRGSVGPYGPGQFSQRSRSSFGAVTKKWHQVGFYYQAAQQAVTYFAARGTAHLFAAALSAARRISLSTVQGLNEVGEAQAWSCEPGSEWKRDTRLWYTGAEAREWVVACAVLLGRRGRSVQSIIQLETPGDTSYTLGLYHRSGPVCARAGGSRGGPELQTCDNGVVR